MKGGRVYVKRGFVWLTKHEFTGWGRKGGWGGLGGGLEGNFTQGRGFCGSPSIDSKVSAAASMTTVSPAEVQAQMELKS